MIKRFTRLFYVFVLTALLAACGAAPTPTPLQRASATPASIEAAATAPTETVAPTATAMPSPTAIPTVTAPFDIRVAQYVLDTAGFHGIAETLAGKKVIESSYLSTTNRVKKVLSHTTWPTELNDQAQTFITTLTDFATALEADKVEDAIKLGEPVHDAQHDFSHAIDEWAAAVTAGATTDPFDVSVAQYFLDNAGFHDIAETLAEKKVIESSYLSTVNRVKKVVTLTTWPTELNEKAQTFITALTDFATALETDKVDEAVKLSETVHDTQHELSHATDEWLASAKAISAESDTFNVHIAQYFMDTAGFHSIAETLAEKKAIDTAYPSKVNRVKKVLTQTVWPAALNEQAQAFIKTLGEFAAALEADKVDEAIKLAATVHDAQHELSHSIDGSEEDGQNH